MAEVCDFCWKWGDKRTECTCKGELTKDKPCNLKYNICEDCKKKECNRCYCKDSPARCPHCIPPCAEGRGKRSGDEEHGKHRCNKCKTGEVSSTSATTTTSTASSPSSASTPITVKKLSPPPAFRVLIWNLENFTGNPRPAGTHSLEQSKNNYRAAFVANVIKKNDVDMVCIMETGGDVGKATAMILDAMAKPEATGAAADEEKKEEKDGDKAPQGKDTEWRDIRDWHPLITDITFGTEKLADSYKTQKKDRLKRAAAVDALEFLCDTHFDVVLTDCKPSKEKDVAGQAVVRLQEMSRSIGKAAAEEEEELDIEDDEKDEQADPDIAKTKDWEDKEAAKGKENKKGETTATWKTTSTKDEVKKELGSAVKKESLFAEPTSIAAARERAQEWVDYSRTKEASTVRKAVDHMIFWSLEAEVNLLNEEWGSETQKATTTWVNTPASGKCWRGAKKAAIAFLLARYDTLTITRKEDGVKEIEKHRDYETVVRRLYQLGFIEKHPAFETYAVLYRPPYRGALRDLFPADSDVESGKKSYYEIVRLQEPKDGSDERDFVATQDPGEAANRRSFLRITVPITPDKKENFFIFHGPFTLTRAAKQQQIKVVEMRLQAVEAMANYAEAKYKHNLNECTLAGDWNVPTPSDLAAKLPNFKRLGDGTPGTSMRIAKAVIDPDLCKEEGEIYCNPYDVVFVNKTRSDVRTEFLGAVKLIAGCGPKITTDESRKDYIKYWYRKVRNAYIKAVQGLAAVALATNKGNPALTKIHEHSQRALKAASDSGYDPVTHWNDLQTSLQKVPDFSDFATHCLKALAGDAVKKLLAAMQDGELPKEYVADFRQLVLFAHSRQTVWSTLMALDHFDTNERIFPSTELTPPFKNDSVSQWGSKKNQSMLISTKGELAAAVKAKTDNSFLQDFCDKYSPGLDSDHLKMLEALCTAMEKASKPDEWRIQAYTYRTKVSDHIPSLTTYGGTDSSSTAASAATSATASAKPS